MPNEARIAEPEAYCAERGCNWSGEVPAIASCPSCGSRQLRTYDPAARNRALAAGLMAARQTFLGIAGSATRAGNRALVRTCELAAERAKRVAQINGGA